MSIEPRLAVVAEDDGIGVTLGGERRVRGISLEQVCAATRIGLGHLKALEREEFDALPGPVYVRGYLRSYAEYLGLDPGPLLARLPAATSVRAASHGGGSTVRARVVLTSPLLGAAALVIAGGLFAAYALYEVRSAGLDSGAAPTPPVAVWPPIASLPPLAPAVPSVAPTSAAPTSTAPAARPIAVAIKATELDWVQVTVDGAPIYGTGGKMLKAGDQDVFIGEKIKIQSGKPSLQVAVSGGDFAALGVLSKEFSAQT